MKCLIKKFTLQQYHRHHYYPPHSFKGSIFVTGPNHLTSQVGHVQTTRLIRQASTSVIFFFLHKTGEYDDSGRAHHWSNTRENQKGELHHDGLCALRHVRGHQHHELAGKLLRRCGTAAKHCTSTVWIREKIYLYAVMSKREYLCFNTMVFILKPNNFFFFFKSSDQMTLVSDK